MLNKVAFSLIELIVVVAIVGILSALAVPAYQNYLTKVKIANAVRMMGQFASIWVEQFQLNGVSPSSIDFGGVTINAATTRLIDIEGIAYLRYDYNSTLGVLRVAAQLRGLDSIPGYTEPATTPTTNTEPTAGMIRTVVYQDSSGVFITKCGAHDLGNPADIPLEFNPVNCQCPYTGDVFNTDVSACDAY